MIQRHQTSAFSLSPATFVSALVPFVFLIASVLFNVFSFASLGTVGGELYAIRVKTDSLHAQNQKLTEALAQKQSLQDTLAQAEGKGYIPVSKLTRVELQDTKVALQVSSGN